MKIGRRGVGGAEALDIRGRGESTNYSGGLNGYGDDRKPYSLKEIFANKYNPDNFEYRTGRTTSLRMKTVSYIQATLNLACANDAKFN